MYNNNNNNRYECRHVKIVQCDTRQIYGKNQAEWSKTHMECSLLSNGSTRVTGIREMSSLLQNLTTHTRLNKCYLKEHTYLIV